MHRRAPLGRAGSHSPEFHVRECVLTPFGPTGDELISVSTETLALFFFFDARHS